MLRSLLKGVVWRVFSTALTVCIILGVFRDTVQVSKLPTTYPGRHSTPVSSRSCNSHSRIPVSEFYRNSILRCPLCKKHHAMAFSHHVSCTHSDPCPSGTAGLSELSCMQVEQALQIGGLEFVLKLLVYFAHERLWVQIGNSIN